jgi:two-component system, cell cycle sensor histidine kinase and response regulator CckA
VASNETTDAGKLAILRQEAAGIAHDFNNLLTVISGHSSLLGTAVSADDPLRSSVTEIQKAAERAAVLTQKLLDLSKREL